MIAATIVLFLASLVVLPEKYARDPGAEFPAVYVTGVVGTNELRAIADRNSWVMVCGGETNHVAIDAQYRTYKDNVLLRRGVSATELLAPGGEEKLRNWFAVSQYTIHPKPITRYGAKVSKAARGTTAGPKVIVPDGWRLVDGDDGLTGCDVRDFYFTVEAYGANLPPPKVALEWPGVSIGGVYGAKDVRITEGHVCLVPTNPGHPPTSYYTMVKDGAIKLCLHHHVEGAQHGPYGGKALPWTEIRASDNWRAAARVMFKAADLSTADKTGGANVNLFGFDSNFPNHHVDHPPHFHVMLEWESFAKNNVGHYTLDARGFITGNNFLVCGDIVGGEPKGYHPQALGETTEYVGTSGQPLFSLEMLAGGVGLILRKRGANAVWRIYSEHPDESVQISMRSEGAADWTCLGSCSVTDDTEKGEYTIRHELRGEILLETFRYNHDTGALLGPPVARQCERR